MGSKIIGTPDQRCTNLKKNYNIIIKKWNTPTCTLWMFQWKKKDPSHSWVCAYQLTSSTQPTGFQLDWGLVTEMAIAERWFCFHRTISVWILRYALGHCLIFEATLYPGRMERGMQFCPHTEQDCWVWGKGKWKGQNHRLTKPYCKIFTLLHFRGTKSPKSPNPPLIYTSMPVFLEDFSEKSLLMELNDKNGVCLMALHGN